MRDSNGNFDLNYFLQIADLAYIDRLYIKRLKTELRSSNSLCSDSDHCKAKGMDPMMSFMMSHNTNLRSIKATIDERFDKIRKTISESFIIDGHTNYGGDVLILCHKDVMIIAFRDLFNES